MARIRPLLLALAVLGLALGDAGAATRRAVLVGINQYTGSEHGSGRWRDLRGSRNDVEALRSILVARHGFARDDVHVLLDADASREAILGALRRHLVEPAQPGDVSLFYYAGHGSQLENPGSPELDLLDETIVPADSNRGVPDIRDKELRRRFNDVLDRGADLVAIFDSCNSGSITRGFLPEEGARFLPPRQSSKPERPTPDDDPRPPPEARGALILSASQDDQVARETRDERGLHRGAFSLALARALAAAPVDESAERLFLRTSALMLADRRTQTPVLSGPEPRRQRPLLAPDAGPRAGDLVVAALLVNPGGEVILDAGFAAGLNEGSELVAEPPGDAPLRLRVESAAGLARATARVVEGDASRIRRGDLFRLDRWVAPPGADLRLAVPAALPPEELRAAATALATLRGRGGLPFVEDDAVGTATHRLRFEDGRFWLDGAGDRVDLGRRPDAGAVAAALSRSGVTKPAIFASLPPPVALARRIEDAAAESRGSLELVPEAEAHYVLAGRIEAETTAYAWVAPDSGAGAGAAVSLPPRSDWVAVRGAGAEAGHELEAAARRLAEIRAWLTLQSPPGRRGFPYHLVLRDAASQKLVAGGVVFEGDAYQLVLQADPGERDEPVQRRYVYVFAVDGFGKRTLLFPPPAAGNVENRLPLGVDPDAPPPALIPLSEAPIEIAPPFGTDTLVLLTTEQPLANPGVLEGDAVRTRALTGETGSGGLEGLLQLVGQYVQGPAVATPATWSVDRIAIRSAPR
jgi:hypothetical protein